MKSFLSRIYNSLTGENSNSQEQERESPVVYNGLSIYAVPVKEERYWRMAGVIVKESENGDFERSFTRADTFATCDEAKAFAIRKGKQIIDERGSKLFEDNERQGRV